MHARRVRMLLEPGDRWPCAASVDGIELTSVCTGGAAEFQAAIRAAQDDALDALAFAGSDRSVGQALAALDVLNRVPFVLLPARRAAHFADDLGIPTAAAEALQIAALGQPRRIDVGRACWPGRDEARRFCSAAVVGFDEQVARSPGVRRWPALRSLAALSTALDVRPRRVEVAWRDGDFQGEALLVAVTNTSRQMGRLTCPRARLHDGLLDLCLVAWPGRLRLWRHLPRLWRGRHEGLPEVILAQTPWVRIDGDELPISFDGEPATERTPVEIHCEAGAAQFLLPQVQAELAAPELLPAALPALQFSPGS